MKITTSLFLFCLAFCTLTEIRMGSLKIGDDAKSLKNLKLEVVAEEDNMTKFKTKDGNDLSVTTQNGKIVYLENDWLQDKKSNTPLVSNLKFGENSLKDIRKQFGSNGFAYRVRGAYFISDTHAILFNCFELDSKNNEILVIITKTSLNENITEENIAELAKLDAIIIADKNYLDEIWGKEKTYDPNYKKVKL